MNTAFRRLQRRATTKQLDLTGKLFFYRYLMRLLFATTEYEDLYFTAILGQNICRFCYTLFSIILIEQLGINIWIVNSQSENAVLPLHWANGILLLTALFLLLFLLGDYLGRVMGNRYPEKMIRLTAPVVSVFLFIFFPFSFIFIKIFHWLPRTIYFDPSHEPVHEGRQELMDFIEECSVHHLDSHDKKLLESVMHFKDRIAREVMVPRVSVFSLPSETTIEKATQLLHTEGYSRIPVYKDTLDNIIGVLMYKDILAKYMEHVSKGTGDILQQPISTLVKNILYTPETKKISHLLQDFRKQQVHLAIVVDEYGGTEGIITIEDILEEIVGDIEDEYDQEESLFIALPEGGWLIDAHMNIFDIEEQLEIKIPQDGDYDTIGGYVFHETGTIPVKGYIIQKPNFEIEVIRSNDRRVEKLRIRPLPEEGQQKPKNASS